MVDILYTYGTLRPGKPDGHVVISGTMFDLGPFPGVRLNEGPNEIVCEPVEVKDWEWYDHYEGYRPDKPEGSLYIRTPILDGYIYVFNRPVLEEDKIIPDGDWLTYRKEREQ